MKLAESGIIDKSGKLMMPKDRLHDFCQRNKGRRVVITFESVEPGTSAAMLAYLYSYILPTVRDAFEALGVRYTPQSLEEFLTEEYCGTPCRAGDMSQGWVSGFIDWLKQYAAENLYVYIEDANAI